MGFFAFVVAPAAFTALDREAAGRFVGAVFPGTTWSGRCSGRVRWWPSSPSACAPTAGMVIGSAARSVLGMLALTLYAWLAVLPAAQAAKQAMRHASSAGGGVEALSFSRLHRLSTILNGAVMLAGMAFVVLDVARRP